MGCGLPGECRGAKEPLRLQLGRSLLNRICILIIYVDDIGRNDEQEIRTRQTSWGSGSVSISTDLPFIADVYAAVRFSVLDMLFVSAVKTGKLTITHISGNSAGSDVSLVVEWNVVACAQ